jgi:hypothetical protein
VGGAVDLHSHTTASDGTLAPAELVREAVRRGVRVLAVTDHDSIDAGPADLLNDRFEGREVSVDVVDCGGFHEVT